MTIAIVSEKAFTAVDGSSFRPLMQSEGLQANGYNDFKLFHVDSLKNFNESDYSIIHAHQKTGLQFSNYLADLHGVYTHQFKDRITSSSFLQRQKLRMRNLPKLKKMQDSLLKRAKGIICAGESIEEYAKSVGTTTYLVRNCVNLSLYENCDYSSSKVCVCGPFLKAYDNYYQLRYVLEMAKKLTQIQFMLIGKIEAEEQDTISKFDNIHVLGYVDNFIEKLRSCSILFAPYPSYSTQGGAKTKLIEAAACGIPIVATSYAICDFQCNDVLIGKDIAELSERLLYLAQSEGNRKHIGQKLKSYVSEYHNYLLETKKLIQVYKNTGN